MPVQILRSLARSHCPPFILLSTSKMSSGRNWKHGGDSVYANAASSAGADSVCRDPIAVSASETLQVNTTIS